MKIKCCNLACKFNSNEEHEWGYCNSTKDIELVSLRLDSDLVECKNFEVE